MAQSLVASYCLHKWGQCPDRRTVDGAPAPHLCIRPEPGHDAGHYCSFCKALQGGP